MDRCFPGGEDVGVRGPFDVEAIGASGIAWYPVA